MGQDVGVGAGTSVEDVTKDKKIKALIVEDVKVLTREIVVDVPKYVDKEQIRLVTVEQEQVRFNTVEQPTVKFIPKEVETIKFIPIEKETIQYKVVVKEFEVERPVLIDKRYERPIIVDKEYHIATYKDVAAITELLSLVPKLMDEIQRLKLELTKVRDYKLVEEIIRVPQIKYIPTEIERVVWKDVPREKCRECGKEVT